LAKATTTKRGAEQPLTTATIREGVTFQLGTGPAEGVGDTIEPGATVDLPWPEARDLVTLGILDLPDGEA
jgi:hypothetical protein